MRKIEWVVGVRELDRFAIEEHYPSTHYHRGIGLNAQEPADIVGRDNLAHFREFLGAAHAPVVPGELALTDVIEVDELRLRCVIGVNREERYDRQDVVISLRIGADARPAAVIDCKDAVWNYRTVAKTIIDHVESSTYLTVEKLASEIARIAVVDHAAPWIEVRVHKPGALRFASSVGVVIHRRPGDFLETLQPPNVTALTSSQEGGQ